MKIGVKVGDVMTRSFISVKKSSSILDCAKTMEKNNVGSLIIKEDGKLHGILTNGDIIKAIAQGKNIHKISAKEIMSKKMSIISPDKDMYDALVAMNKKKIRWLPVVEKGRVIGMLTIKDILRVEPSLFDIAVEGTQIREESKKLRAFEKSRKRAERDNLAIGTIWAREGECEECGNYGTLYRIDNALICGDCRNEKAAE